MFCGYMKTRIAARQVAYDPIQVHSSSKFVEPMVRPSAPSQPCQAFPSHHLCQSARSGPATNTSNRPLPPEDAPGPEVAAPPIDVHGPHVCCQERLQTAELPPVPKTSRVFGAGETAAGPEVRIPPSEFQPDHDIPSNRACQSALSPPHTKMSYTPFPEFATPGADVMPCDGSGPERATAVHGPAPAPDRSTDPDNCHSPPSVPIANTS